MMREMRIMPSSVWVVPHALARIRPAGNTGRGRRRGRDAERRFALTYSFVTVMKPAPVPLMAFDGLAPLL